MQRNSKNWRFRPGRRICALLLVLLLTALWGLGPAVAADQVLGVREKLPNDLVWLFSRQTGLPLVTLELDHQGGRLAGAQRQGRAGQPHRLPALKRHQESQRHPDRPGTRFLGGPSQRRGRR